MSEIDPMRALEQIARMRIFPDDKVNRLTLVAAIEMARTVVAAKLAVERIAVIQTQEGTAP